MNQPLDYQIPAIRSLSLSGTKAAAFIGAASLCVLAFLFWLLYFRGAAAHESELVTLLPAANASFNALSSIFLIAGYIAVRRRRLRAHVQFMFTALGSSTMFLIGYITYHSFHGDTKFQGAGAIRPVYFFILISHIVLSAVVVPMILTSLYLSLSGKLATHKRVSRWTLPIWLYVSVTGVLIFAMLKIWNR